MPIVQGSDLFMNMTNEEYLKLVDEKTPGSKIVKNCVKAFIAGGAICCIGEAFLKLYIMLGVEEETAFTLVTVTMIFLGTLFTGLDIYPRIAKYGGAGTLIPVTGFANAVAAPALEAKPEGYITGVGAKIFTIAGPVILYGTLASVLCGIIYYFTAEF